MQAMTAIIDLLFEGVDSRGEKKISIENKKSTEAYVF